MRHGEKRVSSCGMGTARARGTGLNKCRFTRTGLSALLSTTVVAGVNAFSGRASTTGEPGNSPKQPQNSRENVKGAEHELRKIKPNSGTFFNGAEKLQIPRGRRFQVAGVPPSLRCGVGGEKRQRTGAVQDASRRRGDLRPTGQTREILNSISPNGRDTGNSGNTGFIEHTSLSRRLAKPSRQTREIAAYRQTSRIIVNQSCLESCYISKESCIIVLNRGKIRNPFFRSFHTGSKGNLWHCPVSAPLLPVVRQHNMLPVWLNP